jgi:hypothetical protein
MQSQQSLLPLAQLMALGSQSQRHQPDELLTFLSQAGQRRPTIRQ